MRFCKANLKTTFETCKLFLKKSWKFFLRGVVPPGATSIDSRNNHWNRCNPQRYYSLQILESTFDPAGVGGWPLLGVFLFTLHPAGVKAETHSICNR
jgi:hypothetical protein